ncbi:ATP-grasp domain-containing protein [Candidatus Babeliales bacterium]|nr:ATP-grasp domain-containing protein [Candidatus Babeliales bacterium]
MTLRLKSSSNKKILIANRSEIALRIQATCRALGIAVVAVYAPEDASLRFVRTADQAFALPGSGRAAYMDQEALLAIALRSGADAVHPGYGFLAENATFARRVHEAGLTWVGPRHDLIALMGDKIGARCTIEQAGVPVVPGFFADVTKPQACLGAKERAAVLGYPLMIKDPLGGGGKGMVRVANESTFEHSWDMAVRQAAKLTGSTQLLIERCLENTRHLEVQVAGDGTRAVHFFERECSIQRRHQKIVEESPCLFVSEVTRARLHELGVKAAQMIGYDSVGTVEFLVTADQQCYFLEMNTRLQVEHSVTELTTGVDLVALQIALAQGQPLPYQQAEIVQRGHAVECRIYAEDPEQNFFPSTGLIHYFQPPSVPFMRHDHDLFEGVEITSCFDPMIAKVTTYGVSRTQAIQFMAEALRQYGIEGITTNRAFLRSILETHEFVAGAFDTATQFVVAQQETANQQAAREAAVIIAAVMQQVLVERVTAPQKEVSGGWHNDSWKGQQWR